MIVDPVDAERCLVAAHVAHEARSLRGMTLYHPEHTLAALANAVAAGAHRRGHYPGTRLRGRRDPRTTTRGLR